jgi:hypothetical protein
MNEENVVTVEPANVESVVTVAVNEQPTVIQPVSETVEEQPMVVQSESLQPSDGESVSASVDPTTPSDDDPNGDEEQPTVDADTTEPKNPALQSTHYDDSFEVSDTLPEEVTKDCDDESILPEMHDCKTCYFKRTVLLTSIPVRQEDSLAFDRIVTMMNNAEQMLRTVPKVSSEAEPSKADELRMKCYYEAALDQSSKAHQLINEWWMHAQHIYHVPGGATKFDSYSSTFYICKADNGEISQDGAYRPNDGSDPEHDDISCGCCSCGK